MGGRSRSERSILIAELGSFITCQEGITEWSGQALQNRGVQKKMLDFRRLAGQDLLQQVIQNVAVRA